MTVNQLVYYTDIWSRALAGLNPWSAPHASNRRLRRHDATFPTPLTKFSNSRVGKSRHGNKLDSPTSLMEERNVQLADWNDTTGTKNGHFAPFAWTG